MSKEMDPEDAAKQRITEWVEDYGAEVYWEKKNDAGNRTFHINDGTPTPEKPDLVIDFGDRSFAVEMKHGWSKSGVYDATEQIRRYWLKHTAGNQSYICGGSEVEIDAFLTATRHSVEGRLFNESCEVLLTKEDFSDSRVRAIENGHIPPTEYSMTEQHTRILWRLMKSAVEGNYQDTAGIGSLLSTALHPNWNTTPAPAILWTNGKQQRWDVFNNGR